jgi:hypothetical protein
MEVSKSVAEEISSHYPVHKPETAEAAWREFAEGVITHGKKQETEAAPARTVDTSKLSEEEAKFWDKGAQKEKAPEPKEKPEKADSSGTKGEVRADAKGETKNVPRPDDRTWTTKLEGKELEDFRSHVDTQAKAGVEFVQKHQQRQQIEAGLTEMGKTSFLDPAGQFNNQKFGDFAQALAEIPNPGEVLAHLGITKLDRDALAYIKGWQEMRQAVHGLSRELMPKPAPTPELRPRAPRPIAEVGGRGGLPTDPLRYAAENGDFRSFDLEMRRKYAAMRR